MDEQTMRELVFFGAFGVAIIFMVVAIRHDARRARLYPWLRAVRMDGVARIIRDEAVRLATPNTGVHGGWVMWMERQGDRMLRFVALENPDFDRSPTHGLPRRDWDAFIMGASTALEITGRNEREIAAALWRRAMAARDALPKEER